MAQLPSQNHDFILLVCMRVPLMAQLLSRNHDFILLVCMRVPFIAQLQSGGTMICVCLSVCAKVCVSVCVFVFKVVISHTDDPCTLHTTIPHTTVLPSEGKIIVGVIVYFAYSLVRGDTSYVQYSSYGVQWHTSQRWTPASRQFGVDNKCCFVSWKNGVLFTVLWPKD